MVRWLLGAALALAICGGLADAQPSPRCAVLLGGGGTVTGVASVDGNWFKINSAVSEAVVTSLQAKGYDIRPLIIDVPDGDQRFHALWSNLSKSRCAKTVQISHALTGVNGRIEGFSIQAEVIRFDLSTTGTASVTAVSEYRKAYDFKMTQQVMESLSLSELGDRIADGISQSGVLGSR